MPVDYTDLDGFYNWNELESFLQFHSSAWQKKLMLKKYLQGNSTSPEDSLSQLWIL